MWILFTVVSVACGVRYGCFFVESVVCYRMNVNIVDDVNFDGIGIGSGMSTNVLDFAVFAIFL